MTIKTRFCPSPTGYIHLGNVRTALFSALLAQKNKGTFLLRIEDTDKERSSDTYTEALIRDLKWLGLFWQEGVDAKGDAGPYYQSQRQAIYDKYYKQLIDLKQAYPCFCTEDQLMLQRKLQQQAGKPPRYAGTCRKLTEKEIVEKLAAGQQATLRFHIPDDKVITFHDMVRGEQRYFGHDLGDFIIRRTDGTAPFMYCNAIDDALMGVTHVLRGEDHLTNTPRQLMILDALQLQKPTYGHIALIVGNDGSPLSKRHGSFSVQALNEMGYLPLAILNYLARLGHYYGHDNYLALTQLAEQFNVEALVKSPAKFNPQQLLYWQTTALQHLKEDEFKTWVGEDILSLIPQDKPEFLPAIKMNVTFPVDVKNWIKALFMPLESWSDEALQIIHAAGRDYFIECLKAVETQGVDAKKITQHLKDQLALSGKALFMPLRVVLTLHAHGPDLSLLLSLMSKNEVIRRLKKAIDDTYRD